MSALEPPVSRAAFLDTRDSFDAFVQAWEAGRAEGRVDSRGPRRDGRQLRGALRPLGGRRTAARHQAPQCRGGHAGHRHLRLPRDPDLLLDGCRLAAGAGYSDPWLAARHAVEKVGFERDLHRRYYSFDVVRDEKARASFVPSDREGPY